jgi:hypothetical protein
VENFGSGAEARFSLESLRGAEAPLFHGCAGGGMGHQGAGAGINVWSQNYDQWQMQAQSQDRAHGPRLRVQGSPSATLRAGFRLRRERLAGLAVPLRSG